MNASDWIGIGVIALVVVGGLLLLNQITKPYDVKTEEEFQRRRKEGGRATGLMGLQQILDPAAKKSVEVQQDLRRGIYDDEEEPDDPPEAGANARQKEKGKSQNENQIPHPAFYLLPFYFFLIGSERCLNTSS